MKSVVEQPRALPAKSRKRRRPDRDASHPGNGGKCIFDRTSCGRDIRAYTPTEEEYQLSLRRPFGNHSSTDSECGEEKSILEMEADRILAEADLLDKTVDSSFDDDDSGAGGSESVRIKTVEIEENCFWMSAIEHIDVEDIVDEDMEARANTKKV